MRDFLGKTIVLKGKPRSIESSGIKVELSHAPGRFIHCPNNGSGDFAAGQDVYLSVRPEDVVIMEQGDDTADNTLEGTIETMLFVGDRSECQVKVGDERILLYLPRNQVLKPQQVISLHLPKELVNLWPA